MRGLVYNGPGVAAELVDLPTPEPGPGEVLLRIGANTVCGTDLRILRGEKTKGITPGVVLGHESAGYVEAIGSGVEGFAEGDLASTLPSICCDRCEFCKRGTEHLCTQAQIFGNTINGGLADYMLVPSSAIRRKQLIVSRAALDPTQLALAEPISCCLNGLDNYRVEVSDTVVILGAGPIGLIHMQLALLGGAERVIVSDPSQSRRASAESLGATLTVDPLTEDLNHVVRDLTGGLGADLAVLCIGRPELVTDALTVVRKRGRVSIFAGLAGEGWANIPGNLIHYGELTVTGASNSGRRSFERAIELIEQGKIDTTGLVSHRFGLSEATAAIDFVASGAGLKVAVIPD